MSWYYSENNERRGPVEDADFRALVNSGAIRPETLVWREGYADWMPFRSVAFDASVAAASPVGSSSSAGITLPTGTLGSGAVVCSQCTRMFPADETVIYEGRHVCAACKPLFFQKIREGASVVGHRDYAGFWIRFCAKFVDGILLQIGGLIVGFIIGFALRGQSSAQIVAFCFGLLLNAAYIIYFTGKYGATPGKMVCKLQVIRADGSPMTFGRATGRYFGEMLSSLTLGIGFIMVAFDEEKRALHDRVCDTRVIRIPDR